MISTSLLRYHLTNAETGITYNQPGMNMKQPQADLSIQQPQAVMNINLEPGKLSIDQTEAFASIDHKAPLRRQRDYVNEILAEYPNQVKKMASQGDQMMRIENGGNGIASIAKQNGTPPMKQLGMGFLPKSHFDVKIDYQPANLTIDAQKQDPIIRSSVNKPQIDIPQWSASSHMEQMPSVDFEYVGQHINLLG